MIFRSAENDKPAYVKSEDNGDGDVQHYDEGNAKNDDKRYS
jgi:hypothetical protein